MSETAAGQSHKASWKFRIAIFLISLVLSLCMVEVILRIFWHNPFHGQLPDRILELKLQNANSNYRVDRSMIDPGLPNVLLRTDDRCYIHPSFQHTDPDLTIAFLGGSTTECSAVSETERFHAVVARHLGNHGLHANTLNAARSGNTLQDSINVVLNHVILDKPDVAVVMHAVNDFGLLSTQRGYDSRMGALPDLAGQLKFPLQVLSSNSSVVGLVRNVVTLRSAQSRAVNNSSSKESAALSDDLQLMYRQRLLAFVQVCRAFNIEPVLVTQPLSSSATALTPKWSDLGAQDRLNQIVDEIGSAHDVFVIDLVRHLDQEEPRWREPSIVFYDGMHVTDNGSRLYGEYIANQLLSISDRLGSKVDPISWAAKRVD